MPSSAPTARTAARSVESARAACPTPPPRTAAPTRRAATARTVRSARGAAARKPRRLRRPRRFPSHLLHRRPGRRTRRALPEPAAAARRRRPSPIPSRSNTPAPADVPPPPAPPVEDVNFEALSPTGMSPARRPSIGPQVWSLHTAPPPLDPVLPAPPPPTPRPTALPAEPQAAPARRSAGTARTRSTSRPRHSTRPTRRCPATCRRRRTAFRTWPARTTCRRAPPWMRGAADLAQPNVRYLKELWHAIQNQDITRQGRAAGADPAPLTTPAPGERQRPVGPAPGAEVPPPLPPDPAAAAAAGHRVRRRAASWTRRWRRRL